MSFLLLSSQLHRQTTSFQLMNLLVFIVYGIESILDPTFTVPDSPIQISNVNQFTASFGGSDNHNIISYAANVLISRGYSVFASFLNLQIGSQSQKESQSQSQSRLTLFTPSDEVMVEYPGNQRLFLRHVLKCKVLWRDLMSVDDGTSFDTYLDGFKVNMDRSGGGYKVNEVSITFPDMLTESFDEISDGEEEQDDSDETLVRSSGRRMLITAAAALSPESVFRCCY